MLRRNRVVAGFSIVVIAAAALLPGHALLDCALFEPAWVLLLDETPVRSVPLFAPAHEHPSSLLSLLPSRAPPALRNA
jgi:hypothetical protein